MFTVNRINVFELAKSGNFEQLERSCTEKKDCSEYDKTGWYPLHYASDRGHKETVNVLLRCKAEVNAKDKFSGRTALHYAAWKGYDQIVQLLVDNSANVDVADNELWTPLHFCAWMNHLQTVRTLLHYCANPLAKNNVNQTVYDVSPTRETIEEILQSMVIHCTIHEKNLEVDLSKDDINDSKDLLIPDVVFDSFESFHGVIGLYDDDDDDDDGDDDDDAYKLKQNEIESFNNKGTYHSIKERWTLRKKKKKNKSKEEEIEEENEEENEIYIRCKENENEKDNENENEKVEEIVGKETIEYNSLSIIHTNEKEFNTSGIQLTKILDEETASTLLSRFYHLFIRKNEDRMLPSVLYSLTQLTTLGLCNNMLDDSSFIKQECHHHHNNSLTNLINLREIDLSYNNLTSIPRSVLHLTMLNTLILIGNHLTSVSSKISHLNKLRILNLDDNEPLQSLPYSLNQLNNLEVLSLRGTHVYNTIPKDVIKEGTVTILLFLQQYSNTDTLRFIDEVDINEGKLKVPSLNISNLKSSISTTKQNESKKKQKNKYQNKIKKRKKRFITPRSTKVTPKIMDILPSGDGITRPRSKSDTRRDERRRKYVYSKEKKEKGEKHDDDDDEKDEIKEEEEEKEEEDDEREEERYQKKKIKNRIKIKQTLLKRSSGPLVNQKIVFKDTDNITQNKKKNAPLRKTTDGAIHYSTKTSDQDSKNIKINNTTNEGIICNRKTRSLLDPASLERLNTLNESREIFNKKKRGDNNNNNDDDNNDDNNEDDNEDDDEDDEHVE